MPSEGDFKAGSFQFPTSTGSFSVTGFNFKPQGIIFFGGNQSGEDTLLHPTHPGAFFGMAWTDVNTGNVDYQSQANTSFGVRWDAVPIVAVSTGATIEYRASAVTFDTHGFTLTIATGAPGPRLVHYLAWGNFNGAEGKQVTGTTQGQVFTFPSLGYRPLSGLLFGMFAGNAARSGTSAASTYFTMGTGNFPEDNDPDFNSNSNATALTMHAVQTVSDGLTQKWLNRTNTNITASVSGGVLGYWQDQFDHLRPFPDWDSEGLRLDLQGHNYVGALSWWDCEGHVRGVSIPNAPGLNTYTAPVYIDEVQAALFYGTTCYSDAAQDHGTVNVAYVYGVLTPDYQGVVAFDSGDGDPPADGTPSFFQSQNACYVNSLSPSGGIRVASGEMTGNQVKLTGEISSNSQIGGGDYMQIWGKEDEGSQFFRVLGQ